jgi:hypothetical protein
MTLPPYHSLVPIRNKKSWNKKWIESMLKAQEIWKKKGFQQKKNFSMKIQFLLSFITRWPAAVEQQ